MLSKYFATNQNNNPSCSMSCSFAAATYSDVDSHFSGLFLSTL